MGSVLCSSTEVGFNGGKLLFLASLTGKPVLFEMIGLLNFVLPVQYNGSVIFLKETNL